MPVSLVDDKFIPRKLTPKEAEQLNNGTSYVAIWGFITYSDAFGEHWTRFCDWKSFQVEYREFTARPCTSWSAVGDGKSPDL